MAFKVVPVSRYFWIMGLLPRRLPQLFLVAAFVLLSAGSASTAPLVVLRPCSLLARPVSCSCAAFALFVFVPAALLVACLAALVLEVSLPGYVSESSWETDFRGDEFETRGALLVREVV